MLQSLDEPLSHSAGSRNPRRVRLVFCLLERGVAMPEVESTAISRIAYRQGTSTLCVWFRESGECYRYFGVPPAIYRAFAAAASKGRFFNLHIKDRYDYCRKAA